MCVGGSHQPELEHGPPAVLQVDGGASGEGEGGADLLPVSRAEALHSLLQPLRLLHRPHLPGALLTGPA